MKVKEFRRKRELHSVAEHESFTARGRDCSRPPLYKFGVCAFRNRLDVKDRVIGKLWYFLS